ncbi:MAG: PAS domain S-box protein [Sphingomonadales bacterium]|nr:PAS domain S-box protein [Sphingomonadales bacterium]
MLTNFEKNYSPHLLEILRSMGDGALITDETMTIVFFNKAAEDIFGYTADEVVGHPLTMLLPFDARPDHDRLVKGFTDSGDVRRPMKGRRVKGRRKDGTEFYAEAAIAKIQTDGGLLFSATVRDVTALTLASERLHERNFVMNSISNAQKQMIENKNSNDIFGGLLDDVLAFTGSEYGFIGHVYKNDDGAPYLKTTAITDISWNEETRSFYEEKAPTGMEFSNLESLFGAVLKTGEIVIANDAPNDERATGIPEGHPALNAFLGMPIKSGDDLIGMFGIANREHGYDQDVIERLLPFVTTMAAIFEAYQQRALHLETEAKNERMAKILDGSINEIYVISLEDMTFDTVNKSALENIGYTLEEMRQMSPIDLNPEFKEENFLEIIAPLYTGDTDRVMAEKVFHRKDGSQYDAEIYYSLLYEGNSQFLIGTVIDRTEQKKSEEALLKSQKSLAEAQHIARIGNWEWEIEGDCLTASDFIYDLFGLERTKGCLASGALNDRIVSENKQEIIESLSDIIRCRRQSYVTTYKIETSSGKEIWCHATAEAAIKKNGRVVGLKGTIQDISERMDMEQQLRQAQKMEAVGQLTGGLAHDFNNLLAVVLGTLDLLKDEAGDNPLMLSYIENSRKAATRGAELTQRLLAFSRKQSLKPTLFEINGMIKGMYSLLRSTVGDSIDIQFKPHADMGNVRADMAQMESAILNLAINARDAMPEGGVITIKTSNENLKLGDIDEESNAKPGTFVRVDLVDTGVGMSAETLSRAFDPFYTTKGVGEGSGLGLSMVYGFMMQSGGFARISSVENEGSTISLFIPYVSEKPADLDHTEKDVVVSGVGKKILVLEDEENVRMVAKALLEKVGFEVIETATAAEALKVFYAEGPFDLVLSDIELKGGMKGTEFVELIRKDFPDMRVLFMSGFSHDPIFTSKGHKMPDNTSFLGKPFRRGDLLGKIVQLMDGDLQIG